MIRLHLHSLRSALGNSRGFTIVDILVAMIACSALSLLTAGAFAVMRTDDGYSNTEGLATYLLSALTVTFAAGAAFYFYRLRKKVASVSGPSADMAGTR
ncbi:hypothetical protein [Arthrobacter sp. IK3]|uniref:hypothetical protein n=1 Tax=Arthrobacter sp. IK3 TaxID=3448169 RepID=UPI003EE3AE45